MNNIFLLEKEKMSVRCYSSELIYWVKKERDENMRFQVHRSHDLPSYLQNNEIQWRKNHEIHREYGLPAIISKRGDKEWMKNGDYFRENNYPTFIEYNGNIVDNY
jgi:hypothetical protein